MNKHTTLLIIAILQGWLSLQAFEVSDSLAPEQFQATQSENELSPSPDEIFLKGLAQQYPKQVVAELPQAPSHSKINPIVQELPRNIVYIRIYNFATDLSETLEYLANPALILDLRYVFSAEKVEYIAALENLEREHPMIVLINNKTSGPWETQLADLQAKKKITTIGMATAGNTGIYEQFWESPVYYKLTDEILTQNDQSILQTGLIPDVSIDVRPDDDYQSYYAINKGYKVDDMILLDYGDSEKDGKNNQPNSKEILNDKVLQRAVDIIVALQILGDLPF